MTVIDLICPICGAEMKHVELAEGKHDIYCQYCGNHVILNDDNHKVIKHRNIDEAKIQEVQEKAKDMTSRRKIGVVLLAVGILLLILCAVMDGLVFFTAGASWMFFVMIMLFN